MLTIEEIRILNEARTLLQAIENRCGEHRRDAPKDWREADGYDYGRAAEAVQGAESALFNVLNTLNAYRIQAIEDEQLHNREEVPA